MSKIKILFLAANPAATTRLQLDEEIREITTKIRAAEHRDSLEIIPRFAVRTDDLLQALLQHQPHIVHFCGHGSTAGELIVLDNFGQSKPISKNALVHLFGTLRDNIRVVLLNACYSQIQADALTSTIDCTIGMNKAISNRAAIVFAASFYRAVGFGRSLQKAFDIGKAALLLEGIAEHDTPKLSLRDGVNPSDVVLVTATSTETPSNPIFQPIWGRLDENLQNAFALAATAARREGKDYISTSTLFASLRRLNPVPLLDFFRHLPDDALPEPIPEDVPIDVSAIDSINSLSPCVNSSMSSLTPKATPQNKVSSKDIFIYLARHGTGKSVWRLRARGVGETQIEEIVRQLGWQVMQRE